jgi:hypothetical protein
MSTRLFERALPVAGVIGGLLFAIGLVMSSGEPGDSASRSAIVSFWRDHQGYGTYSLFGLQWLTFLLVVFGAALRSCLRSGEADEATYSAVAFGGAIVAAVSSGGTGLLIAAAAHAADQGNDQAVVTINQIVSYDWVPWTAGFAAMVLATGLGGLRTLTLPRWLSWCSVVLGAALITPIGIIGFLVLPVWLIATGVTLIIRQRATAAAVRPTAPVTAVG